MRPYVLAFLLSDMDVDACYKIGYILKPHGLKGSVTMAVDVDAPDLLAVDSVFVEIGNRLVPHFIEDISVRGDKAFVKFEDVDSPESAHAISKATVFLPKASRDKSGRNEFYDDEIVGFDVVDKTLGSIGIVDEVIAAGPNKLLSILKEGKEVLVPVNGPFITSINKSKKKITVDLPEGFLDI